MLITIKKLKITQKLTVFLPLSLFVLCLLLASCYTLYPAPSGTPGTGSTTTQTQQGGNTTPATPVFTPPPLVTGTVVPGDTLTEKLAWLQRSADSHNTYILEVNADENIAPTVLEYRGAINITIALRGDGENRTIRLRSNGSMFSVRSNVTFVLEKNITLMGHPQNNDSIVSVGGGIFIMNPESAICGNSRSGGSGGGVSVWTGTFEMNGGTISDNSAYIGGGVWVQGTFIMRAGTISDNTAYQGGGVWVWRSFTMSGGTISGNTASQGGGVFLNNNGPEFIMSGGTIAGNIARENGGGVFAGRSIGSASIRKTGGTITGYSSDSINGNVVMDEAGNILARSGHAVYSMSVSDTKRRETTAGPNVNLSTSSNTGWE